MVSKLYLIIEELWSWRVHFKMPVIVVTDMGAIELTSLFFSFFLSASSSYSSGSLLKAVSESFSMISNQFRCLFHVKYTRLILEVNNVGKKARLILKVLLAR